MKALSFRGASLASTETRLTGSGGGSNLRSTSLRLLSSTALET